MKIKNPHDKKPDIFAFIYIWSKMLSSSLDTLLKVSKTTSPQKLFAYDCVTLYLLGLYLVVWYFLESSLKVFCRSDPERIS